ncbi:MAG: GtrA family protein [Burkholderiales bacterium]|nr:GtrA family protein [Burkholderiales bacterium]
MRLIITYAILSLISTAANIGVQDIVIRSYSGRFDIPVSILFGTGFGLFIKYILDKQYIFRFRPRNAMHDGRTFVLYALMGLITTAVFWGFEFGFQYFFATKEMRYVGGMIGLAIGYLAKFHLDKRFVFRTETA